MAIKVKDKIRGDAAQLYGVPISDVVWIEGDLYLKTEDLLQPLPISLPPQEREADMQHIAERKRRKKKLANRLTIDHSRLEYRDGLIHVRENGQLRPLYKKAMLVNMVCKPKSTVK